LPCCKCSLIFVDISVKEKKSGRKIDLAEVVIAYLTEEAEEEV